MKQTPVQSAGWTGTFFRSPFLNVVTHESHPAEKVKATARMF